MFSIKFAQALFPQLSWFSENLENLEKERFFIFFNAIGKKISVEPVSAEQLVFLKSEYPDIDFTGWNQQDLARLLALLKLQQQIDAEIFLQLVEQQFHPGTPSEQASLLKSLSLLNNPAQFEPLARFATRSNVAEVFLALAHHNPFPALYFDETGWNQLILKALFNGFQLAKIIGLHERHNANLAESLRQFAFERQAAGRPVSEELWPLANAFLPEG